MSYTEIHFLDADKEKSHMVGEVKNAFRGAMYVWNHIAIKYFGVESFPMFDESMRSKVWNAGKHKDVEEHDLFVLASTMDSAVILIEHKDYAVEMMRKFHDENPNSSIGEQADFIDSCESKNGCFAFCQTSVCEFWGLSWDDELDKDVYMDLDGDTFYFCAATQTKARLALTNKSDRVIR